MIVDKTAVEYAVALHENAEGRRIFLHHKHGWLCGPRCPVRIGFAAAVGGIYQEGAR